MHNANPTPAANDLLALCICWGSALGSAAAIISGVDSTLLLLFSSFVWAAGAIWIGGLEEHFRIPLTRYRNISGAQAKSVLARPMMKASFVLLTQAILVPLYRLVAP